MSRSEGRREKTLLMIGEMLLILQKLEQYVLAALLGMVTSAEADQKLEKVLLKDKETLGRLMKHLADRVALPEHFAATFEDLLSRRNLLTHNLVTASWFDLKSDEGCAVLDEYMRETRKAAKVVLHVLLGVIGRMDAGLSKEGETRQARILERLITTAEPDFGGLSEEQYIQKVVATALASYRVERKTP